MKRILSVIVGAMLFAGCSTPKATLQVRRPPTLELPPVKVLAVDDLEATTRGDEAIARHVKAALIAAINKEGAIQAMDLAEARERAGKEGLKVEAILRGRVRTDFVALQGLREPIVTSDLTWSRTDKGVEYISESRDKVEVQTYEIVKAFVSVQLNVVQLNGNEERTVAALVGGRGIRHRIGGGGVASMDLWTGRAETSAAGGDRSREGLLRASADKAVAEFTKALSPHTETILAVIAKGGDSEAANLIRNGKYNEAIERLEPGLQNAGKDRAPDLYNLGLAYEALGDPALFSAAILFYRKALDADPEGEDAPAGIGRVEGMMMDSARMTP